MPCRSPACEPWSTSLYCELPYRPAQSWLTTDLQLLREWRHELPECQPEWFR
jgi:hypothetical protein